MTIGEGAGRSFFEADGREYFVHNNNWNDNAGGNSVITACNYDNWYLISNTPNHSDLSVQTYPNVHRDYNDIALSPSRRPGSRPPGRIAPAAFGTSPSTSGSVTDSHTS